MAFRMHIAHTNANAQRISTQLSMGKNGLASGHLFVYYLQK